MAAVKFQRQGSIKETRKEGTAVMGVLETGSGGLKRQLVENLCHQKKRLLQFWFHLLLLLCLAVSILCYTLSSSSQSWWERFSLRSNWTNKFNLPKHRVSLNTTLDTVHTTIPPTIPPTVPPTIPPTIPLTIPLTIPPTIPTTIPTTIPPTVPPTIPTTVPPTVPPIRTQYHIAYPQNYHFIMDNTEVCKTKTPFLVLMVPVEPNNVAARDAIRHTWGNSSLVQGEVVLTLFMLGLSRRGDVEQLQEKLKQENLQHHDLLQSDFMDSYVNLTIKTMVIMNWLATRCPTAAYAMKIDSDMFLNIDNLVIMLQKPGIPRLNYMTGMLMWNRPVVRSKNSKWYVPEEMYPQPIYPTYILGMGYVFSNDLPEKLVEVSKSIKPFNIEDAYIGVCMKKLGLALTSPPNPSQFRAFNTRYNRCEYSKVITYILGSPQQLVKYWTDLKKPGPPC